MNIGALDRKITIQSYALSGITTAGEQINTWSNYATVWATVVYPTSPERLQETSEQGRETATIPVEFTIYFRNDITEKMRIYWESEYYEIQRVNRAGQRNELLKLVTQKKV